MGGRTCILKNILILGMAKIRVVKNIDTNGVTQKDPYNTVLSPQEAIRYQKWKSTLPKNLQYEGDYDLAGLWKENPNVKPSPNMHFPDKYKKPNHPTFSDESIYFGPNTKRFAGKWQETNDSWIYQPYDTLVKKRIVEIKGKDL
jgi:hypothetical protein